jgi:CRP-like cAMP-binding protein
MIHSAANTPSVLAQLQLFHELTTDQLAAVAEGTRVRTLPRGEMLFQKGDAARGFFVILTGQIKLAFPSAQGNEKIVEVIGPRQSFGEAVMFMDRPYPVFAQALIDTTLLQIGQGAVFDLLKTDVLFARTLLAGLSQRLHGLVHDVESYSLRSSTQRVIGYLLQLCHINDDPLASDTIEISLPTAKQVLASRLNLTPETLSRVFHELQESGLIHVSGKRISIPDIDALRTFDI